MNAKIDKNGSLHIKRKGMFKKQFCPHNSSGELGVCGDWCPKFDDGIAFNHLIVCGKEMDIIIDERDYEKETKTDLPF